MTKYLNIPMYPAALAGRFVKLSPGRVRRWLQGYEFSYETGEDRIPCLKHKEPIVYNDQTKETSYASFLDLIDLLFVKQFLEYGVSLQRIRKAFCEAQKLIGGHHFAQRTFFTDGHNIFIKVKEQGNAILELLSGGQWVIAPIIEKISHQIEFDKPSGFAQRWYPLGKKSPVIIDPAISFGQPSLVGHGISTSNVYDLFVAENEKFDSVKSWFKINEKEAGAAVEFERWLMAA
jgi:uncharacterized protein (DUF433 family)